MQEQIELKTTDFRIHPMGDSALLVRLKLPAEFSNPLHLNQATKLKRIRVIRELAGRLKSDLPAEPGWPNEFVNGFDSLLVPYNPQTLDIKQLVNLIKQQIEEAVSYWRLNGFSEEKAARAHKIPVVYGGNYGPDLEEVSRQSHLKPEEVIALHSDTKYTVLIVGGAAGFAYLGPLSDKIIAPRRKIPRPKIAKGSVAVASGMTGIYPMVLPGGWNLIGYTPVNIFDLNQDPPVRFLPGDQVSFEPINEVDIQSWLEKGQDFASTLFK